ncbi:hypothetical protein N7499_005951 [Penicillium canescens]|uniref:FAD/NAD(P)-binding domain-containing protein n=1 Tax=Penicillium canescens TaxID=5083 RepID=A0AAD6NA15_PENCN|nr:uncharacterized protein N7446_001723 [Penicillium canescens]KAJ5997654.1 hypothetical protein N7522_009314 [Penicillium canescens]KAJ6043525.1 hypothetical protein N7460_004880 [Penicillium canescens]KAJ6054999.1 hypothetical protein N7444_004097 [Penicillium canescens]KAJ6073946.1 hypothetical protein N7446_001723 [Penicillium canescens]KAJ6081077.1 hypothetical protein N7499_005951 [Penicillium canescens]
MASRKCAAVVVGAGPAGVAVVGNLLERQLGMIAWIDPYFEGGRVNKNYREVPSNTKVSLFQAYATATQPFQKAIENTSLPNAFSALAKLDQDKTCHLHYAADMVRGLTDGLKKMDDVYACRGFVSAANLSEGSGSPTWTIRITQQDSPTELQFETVRLILCTGSHPTTVPLPIQDPSLQRLDLDLVLKPSALAKTLRQDVPLTTAVVGASHSAILALLNLINLHNTSHPNLRVKWFTRHPLRYAEYKDGWILRDNTGLKGMAAEFARTQLEDDKLATSPAGKVVTKIDCAGGREAEGEMYRRHLPGCDYIVQAVGYTRDPLPQLAKDGAPLAIEFDHGNGRFHQTGGADVPGLFGAGIAFPERVVDPLGNVEYAVGFFKFMKFLKRVVPTW